MDVLELFRTRRSIRKYKGDEVSDELITKILDAGRWAPSARNTSDVSFVVVREEASRKRLAELCPFGPFLTQAPVAVIVAADTSKGRWGVHDASAAIENILLATHGLGLGSCWLGRMEPEAIRSEFGIPEQFQVITVLPIGYPAEDGRSKRPPLETLVHHERW